MGENHKHTWYPDEKLFLKKYFFHYTNSQLLNHINSNRLDKVKLSSMLHQCRRMGLRRGIQIRWSKEDTNYLLRNWTKMGDKELAEKLTKRRKTFRYINGKKVFRKFTKKNVEKKRKLLKLRRNHTQINAILKRNIELNNRYCWSKDDNPYTKGVRKAHNDGDTTIIKYNNTIKRMIKINGVFTPYTRWYYQNFIGPIPKGYKVYHKDLDSLNDNPNNLFITKASGISIQQYRDAIPLLEVREKKILESYPISPELDREKSNEIMREYIRIKNLRKKYQSIVDKRRLHKTT